MSKRKIAAEEEFANPPAENPVPHETANSAAGDNVEPFSGQPLQASSAESTAPRGQEEAAEKPFNPVRGWRHRNNEPVRYQVLTDARIKKIIIKFNLAQGQQSPSEEILDVMRTHKTTADGNSTGLKFEDNRLHGKAWTLPNDSEGRAVLAAIETALEKIASKTPSVSERGA
jgi:hypothetical protein